MQIIIGFVLLFGIILQTTVVNYIAIFGVKPDLLLIIVVYLGFKRGSLTGEISGFFGGFLEDLFTGNLIGINALAKTIIGYIVGLARGKLAFENTITQVVITFIATLVGVIISFFAAVIFTSYIPSILGTIKYAVIASFYNGILAIFIFRFLDKLHISRNHER